MDPGRSSALLCPTRPTCQCYFLVVVQHLDSFFCLAGFERHSSASVNYDGGAHPTRPGARGSKQRARKCHNGEVHDRW